MLRSRLLAEFISSFVLTFVVWLSVVYSMPISMPVIAALVAGLFYIITWNMGGVHLNPVVTLGLLIVRRTSGKDAILFIVAQFIGALGAMLLGNILTGDVANMAYATGVSESLIEGASEAIGAFIFLLAFTAVTVRKSMDATTAGFVVAGGYLLGIYSASALSNGLLNPAVALGVGSFSVSYIVGPIIGGLIGAFVSSKTVSVA